MVQQRPPLHLLLCQCWIGERIRSGGDDERRGGASHVPRNLRQRVHVLQNALEYLHLQQRLLERAGVAERDGRRGQDGVEGCDLLMDEMVLCLCVERGLVGVQVGVPPPLALDVERRRRGGDVRRCVDNRGHNGRRKREAGPGRVEVQDGGFAAFIHWWLGRIVAGNHWGLRAGCIIFEDRRAWSMSGCRGFREITMVGF